MKDTIKPSYSQTKLFSVFKVPLLNQL